MANNSWEVIYQDSSVKDIELEYNGVKIPIKIREIGWSEKNQILTKCFSFSQDGGVNFDYDKYNKMMLCKMIVSAPWGSTDMIFCAKIKGGFGSILEKIIPKAFEDVKTSDFLAKE